MQFPVFSLKATQRIVSCARLHTPNKIGEIIKRGDSVARRRVVIIEDQRMFAEFLSLHCRELRMEVVATCGTGAAGLAAVRKGFVDLLLLDLSLPDADGLELARVLMAEFPLLKVLGVSAHHDPYTMLQVQRLGLHGFIDKHDQRPEVLSEAIKSVLSGHIYYSPVVVESCASLRRDPKAFIRVLSDYEIRILSLIGESKTDDEIAAILAISATTVQSRRRDIMKKIDVHSTPKLIHFAIINGLTRPEQLNSGV